jgi:hypothetical protein
MNGMTIVLLFCLHRKYRWGMRIFLLAFGSVYLSCGVGWIGRVVFRKLTFLSLVLSIAWRGQGMSSVAPMAFNVGGAGFSAIAVVCRLLCLRLLWLAAI